MYQFLFLFLLSTFSLKQDIPTAKPGDFIVYAYKQSLVLVRIAENSGPLLVVEEISAPVSTVSGNWQEWLSKEAPGHSSWTISRINVASGKLVSIFSVDERTFLDSNPAFQFLPTLFTLDARPIDPSDQKRIGPQPLPGEKDFRQLWRPKIMFEGKQISPPIQPYRVLWPNDDSELSGKPIDIYLVREGGLTYLPYWIEVAGALGKAKISAIDSGKNLSSPVILK